MVGDRSTARRRERDTAAGRAAVLYGPFRKNAKHTSASNRAFDAQLRSENPEWGVRDLEEVEAAANAVGFEPIRTFEMPANNLIVVFRMVRRASLQVGGG